MSDGVDIVLDDEEIEVDVQSDALKGDKGDKGDTGAKGDKGDPGQNGYTPVKGVDYFTTGEIAEIEGNVGISVIETITPTLESKQDEITSLNKLESDLVDDTNQTNKFVTTSEKTTWSAKYDKPGSGIPKTDLSSDVQTSLGKADTAIQSHQDLTDYVQNTDYATSSKAGVIKTDSNYGITTPSGTGLLQCYDYNYTEYGSKGNRTFISKGTLENVITGKQLTNKTYVDNYIQELEIENERIKSTLPTTTGTGENITLDKTAEMEFVQAPYPRGNSTQADISYIDVGAWEQGTIDTTTGQDSSASTYIRTDDYIPVFPNVLYNMSRTIYTTYNAYRFYGVNKQYLGNQATEGMVTTNQSDNRMGNGISSMTMTIINTNVAYMRITDSSNDLSTVYTMSTASPNPSYPQPIKNVTGDVEVKVQNKNIATEIVQGNIDTATGEIINNPNAKYGITPNYIEINQTNIAVQYQLTNSTSYQIVIYKYDENKNFLGFNNKSSNSNVFTVDSNVKYIRVRLQTPEANVSSVYNVQIEQNTTATSYVAHAQQTFTFPLGTQRMFLGDYLGDDGIHHVRKQVVFDGSEDETWVIYQTGTENYYYRYRYLSDYKYLANQSNFLCNEFQKGSVGGTNTNEGIYISNNGELRLRFGTEMTLENFKQWLANHNLIIEYELLDSELENNIDPYTTEQQTVYNQIKQAISYEEQNNISGSSDEANPIYNVEAYQSIKLVLQGE